MKSCIATLLLFLSVGFSLAQSQATLTTDVDSIEPNKVIKVTLASYSFNVDTTDISWFINGKPYTSGLGLASINVPVGDIGTVVTVAAQFVTPEKETLRSQVTLSPQSVDLVWEAQESYTPPFYEGKALPGEGAMISLTAIPNMSVQGVQASPENIAYAWFVNGEALLNTGGIGQRSVKIPLETLTNETEIKVKAQTTGGALAIKTIIISPHDILPTMYAYDPILGVDRSQALIRRFETTKEFTLSFEPYYFSMNTPQLSKDSSIVWLLNGLPISPEGRTLSLKPQKDSYGSKSLSVSIESAKRFLQKGKVDLDLVFDTRN